MKSDGLMKGIQWFFRVLSWFMMSMSIIMLGGGLFIYIYNAVLKKSGDESLALECWTLTSWESALCLGGIIVMFFIYSNIWKLIRRIRQEQSVTTKLVTYLKNLSILFLINFGLSVVNLIDKVYANQPQTTDAVTMVAQLLFPRFGGITSFWLFLFALFMIRFLNHHMELKHKAVELEEEQKLIV